MLRNLYIANSVDPFNDFSNLLLQNNFRYIEAGIAKLGGPRKGGRVAS